MTAVRTEVGANEQAHDSLFTPVPAVPKSTVQDAIEYVAALVAETGVIAGSYTSADITVDARGRITAAANGAGGAGVSDGDKGDITVSASGATWTIDSNVISAFGRTLVDDADASAARTTLGLVIGTNVQAFDADLATWAGITPGTGVGTALAVNVGSSGAFVTNGGALGTPSSGTLTNCTGLPLSGVVDSTSEALGVGTLELGHASDTTLARSAAGEMTIEGTLVKKVGTETIWVPAGAMTARTTNGAAAGTTELTTNDVMLRTFDFDTTTEEGVGFWVAFPKSWNLSTVTFSAHWTAASGSGGVAWGLAAYAFSDDDAMDTAVSGQQIVTDTLITANDMHVTSTSSAITIGGTPAVGDAVYFELTREVGNGSDTLGVDARLIGIRLFFTSNASTDA